MLGHNQEKRKNPWRQKELRYKVKHGNQINELTAEDVQNLGEEIDIYTGRYLETKLSMIRKSPIAHYRSNFNTIEKKNSELKNKYQQKEL